MFNAKLAVVIAFVLLAFAVLYQQQRIKTMKLLISGAQSRISSLENGLAALKSQDAKNRSSIEKLLIQQDQISQNQVEQQNAFMRLQNNYSTVKDWSNVPLPAELTSLLNRPARIGFGGYGGPVRTGDPLPAARIPATEKR